MNRMETSAKLREWIDEHRSEYPSQMACLRAAVAATGANIKVTSSAAHRYMGGGSVQKRQAAWIAAKRSALGKKDVRLEISEWMQSHRPEFSTNLECLQAAAKKFGITKAKITADAYYRYYDVTKYRELAKNAYNKRMGKQMQESWHTDTTNQDQVVSRRTIKHCPLCGAYLEPYNAAANININHK